MEEFGRHICNSLGDAHAALARLLADTESVATLSGMAQRLVTCFQAGNKVMACGNGGSACDAAHFAQEFTGRYRADRPALPVIALTDGAHLTCVGNDYGFQEVFARGVAAFGRPGDVLVALSTSGNSTNVVRAVNRAADAGLDTFLFLGKSGGALKGMGTYEIVVPGATADRIQEVHMLLLHVLIECVERRLYPSNY